MVFNRSCSCCCYLYGSEKNITEWTMLMNRGFQQNLKIPWAQLCGILRFTRTPQSILGRERDVLFNDALNTFYLEVCGVRHIVKDHSDSEIGNPLPPIQGLLFLISSKGSFICIIPQTAHTTAFVTPVVTHWLEREIAQWVHHERLT